MAKCRRCGLPKTSETLFGEVCVCLELQAKVKALTKALAASQKLNETLQKRCDQLTSEVEKFKGSLDFFKDLHEQGAEEDRLVAMTSRRR